MQDRPASCFPGWFLVSGSLDGSKTLEYFSHFVWKIK